MTRSHPRQPSQRTLRVGELIRHALADILTRGHIRSPLLDSASLTVTAVDVSPDLKNATAYVMPLGGQGAQTAEKELNRLSGAIRGELGRAIALKYTPSLRFRLDRTFDEADRIESLLRSKPVRRDLTEDGDEDLG